MYGSDIISLRYYAETLSGNTVLLDSIFGQQQTSQSSPWDSAEIALGSFSLDTFRILICPQVAGTASNVAVDDFEIFDTPCQSPDSIVVLGITSASATVHWKSSISTSTIEYGLTGFSPGSGSILTGVSSGFVLQNLLPNSTYDLYIMDSCAIYGTSPWSSVIMFKTDCISPQASFSYSEVDSTFTFIADTSLNASHHYHWNFGDGSSDSGAIVQHTYKPTVNPAPYTVILVARNDCNQSDSISKTILSTIAQSEQFLQEIVIFPNPTSSRISIDVPNRLKDYLNILVYDPSGHIMVLDVSDTNDQIWIDFSEQPAGWYSIRITLGNHEMVKRILLVK